MGNTTGEHLVPNDTGLECQAKKYEWMNQRETLKIFGQWRIMAVPEERVLVVAVGTSGGKAGQRLETGRPVRKDGGRPGSEIRKELMQKEGLTQPAISERRNG